eukprot:COSAG01_NODE_12376_length_1750_cov_10.332526_3_plen_85_part_00
MAALWAPFTGCAPPPPRCGMEALPAGDEKPAGMRCRFCNRPGNAAKGSRRGRKKVRFHRCEASESPKIQVSRAGHGAVALPDPW